MEPAIILTTATPFPHAFFLKPINQIANANNWSLNVNLLNNCFAFCVNQIKV